MIFYASLLKAMGRQSRIVGIDIEIRPHNRKAIEQHELAGSITLIEGDSAAPNVVTQAAASIRPGDCVLVILDSLHTRDHVTRELEAYHRFVSPGSYVIATDGIMQSVADTPRGRPDWTWDNPSQAAIDFACHHPEFVIEPPQWRFNESRLDKPLTYWPSAWLKRVG